MPDEYEALRRRIEEGLAAADELQRRLAAAEKRDRSERKRKFQLIKGGLLGAGIWGLGEWLRSYKRAAVALMATGITVGGAVIAEHPGPPGANDPPGQVITQPRQAKPTKRPTATSTPRRTSPPRVPMRITPPPAALPSATQPAKTKEPPRMPTTKPTRTPTKSPTSDPSTPTVSLPATPTVTVTLPVVTPSTPCTLNLLGVKVCLPLG